MKQEIFGLELNEEGIYWLSKFRALAAIVLAATIIVHGLFLYTTVSSILKANNTDFVPSKFRLMNTLFVVSMSVNFVLQALQVIYYYRFAASSHQAIETRDQAMFNTSFKWLYRQAITFIILFSTSLVYFLYSYFTRPN